MRKLYIVESLREAIAEEMRRDDRVFCIGEGIGTEGGFGGAFTVTLDLWKEFGHERILDTPISEIGLIGVAVGAAVMGMRPIADFQYADFIFCAMDQVVNQAAKLRYMSGGKLKVPLVLRAPVGATTRGAQHAQSVESFFIHVPGWKIVVPSTAYDAKGLLKSAVRDDNPVLIFEHKLLYGSKFHSMKQSRGQQGIGISAAGMYGVLTTGRPVSIVSRIHPKKPAYFCDLQINTKLNRPDLLREEEKDWDAPHGTEVAIELAGKYQRGKQSIDEYLRQTAIANPHVQMEYRAPDGQSSTFARVSQDLPPSTREIKPHPHGIELGLMQSMLKETKSRWLCGFLQAEFSRVSARVAEEICRNAGLKPEQGPHRLTREDVEKLMQGIGKTKIMNPPTDCVAPIGEEQLVKGLQAVVPADFYASATRPPAVYRGNPFIIEAALAWGGANGANGANGAAAAAAPPEGGPETGEAPARLLRLANRVPLLHQQGACCAYQATVEANWRNYALTQPRGGLPVGPNPKPRAPRPRLPRLRGSSRRPRPGCSTSGSRRNGPVGCSPPSSPGTPRSLPLRRTPAETRPPPSSPKFRIRLSLAPSIFNLIKSRFRI